MEINLNYYTSEEFLAANMLPAGEYSVSTEKLIKFMDEDETEIARVTRVKVINSDGYTVKEIDHYDA